LVAPRFSLARRLRGRSAVLRPRGCGRRSFLLPWGFPCCFVGFCSLCSSSSWRRLRVPSALSPFPLVSGALLPLLPLLAGGCLCLLSRRIWFVLAPRLCVLSSLSAASSSLVSGFPVAAPLFRAACRLSSCRSPPLVFSSLPFRVAALSLPCLVVLRWGIGSLGPCSPPPCLPRLFPPRLPRRRFGRRCSFVPAACSLAGACSWLPLAWGFARSCPPAAGSWALLSAGASYPARRLRLARRKKKTCASASPGASKEKNLRVGFAWRVERGKPARRLRLAHRKKKTCASASPGASKEKQAYTPEAALNFSQARTVSAKTPT
jgi:hypothetical protein